MKKDAFPIPRAVLGPTNTGKTHYAIERMLAHSSGMMGFPLRLLAREVYDRCVKARGADQVALITGEEKILPKDARYFLCTVESMPADKSVSFLAIDEVQLAADPARGHVFTDRILHARGRDETLFLGSDTILPRLNELVPGIELLSRPRFSELTYVSPLKLSRLPKRSVVVAFSAEDVYGIAEAMRRLKGGTAIVMGALSPRTRNAQVEMYQAGEVDYLVATDAVGMGLNLDVDHVAFAATRKFDGWRWRDLSSAELGQIAGRAGRHRRNGTFGTLAGGETGGGLDSAIVARLQDHRFEPLKSLFWRNTELDFRSIEQLIASLEMHPTQPNLVRARDAVDLAVLKILASDREIRDKVTTKRLVEKLWDAAQIPDFRKVTPEHHAQLVKRIFEDLSGPAGVIAHDFVAAQVKRLDVAGGEITQIAQRIASIRVWTYVSHRRGWLKDPEHWAEETRRIEDKLSDALHEALTQRFVDRRTSVIMRGLKLKEDVRVLLEDTGEILVEGHVLGHLHGFTFTPKEADSAEQRALTGIAEQTCKEIVATRLQEFGGSDDAAFQLVAENGILKPEIHWRGAAIAKLEKGESPLRPKLALVTGTLLEGAEAEYALDRLYRWLGAEMVKKLGPLAALDAELREEIKPAEEAPALVGIARGIAFRLVEHMGVMPRETVSEDIKQVPQDDRKGLRRHHIRIGVTTLYIPELLKPAPTALRLLLWALHDGPESLPAPPTPGMVWAVVDPTVPNRFYEAAGYRVAGPKAIRIDMLERLADAVRPLGEKRGWFPVSPEIMGLVGCSGDDFAAVMRLLGYRNKSVPADHPDAQATAPAVEAAGQPTETPVEAPAEFQVEAAVETAAEAPAETVEAAEIPAEAVAEAVVELPADAAPAEAAAVPDRMVFQWAPRRDIERKPRFEKKPHGERHGGERHGGERRGGGERKDGDRRPKRDGAKPNFKGGKPGGKPGDRGPKRDFSGPRPEKREKPMDPNSPFAALSVLLKK